MSEDKLILVCGIPRTGTSLVSAIVSALGVPFDRGEVTEFTPIGSYEDSFVVGSPDFMDRYSTGLHGIKRHGFAKWEKEILDKKLPIWKAIETVRNKICVKQSLVEKRIRCGICPEEAKKFSHIRYRNCSSRVRTALQGCPRVRVDYDELVDNPKQEIIRIAEWIEVECYDIDTVLPIVRPELRHYRVK